jgi:hypothetical protein
LLALKNTNRAMRLYRPVARLQSVRRARRRVWAWSIMLVVASLLYLGLPAWWSMGIFVITFLGLTYRLVGWQDMIQRRWEREHTL